MKFSTSRETPIGNTGTEDFNLQRNCLLRSRNLISRIFQKFAFQPSCRKILEKDDPKIQQIAAKEPKVCIRGRSSGDYSCHSSFVRSSLYYQSFSVRCLLVIERKGRYCQAATACACGWMMVVVALTMWGSCSYWTTRRLPLLSITILLLLLLLSRPHYHSTNAMVIVDHRKISSEAAAPSSATTKKIRTTTTTITGQEDHPHRRQQHSSDRCRWQTAVDLLQTTAQARGRTDRRAGKARLVGLFLVDNNHDHHDDDNDDDGKNTQKMLSDFLVAVQPDRSCGRKFIFLDLTANNNGNNSMLGSMLIENAPQQPQQSGQQPVIVSSRLRGMWIAEAVRGRGYSQLFLAVWLRLCLETGVAVPNTRRINKPLLARSLQTFGFTPIRSIRAAAADDDVDGQQGPAAVLLMAGL